MSERDLEGIAPNIMGETFVWRPVLAGMCSFTDLDRLTLCDIADMNEALDLKAEAEKRAVERARSDR